jgi:hypothetical protein
VAGALLPHALERMAAIPMGLALIWLGYSLWTDQRKTTAAPILTKNQSDLDPTTVV